jgi:DNA-binding NarL/FixJ family response regulator
MYEPPEHNPSTTAVTVLTGRFDDLLARGLRAVIESDPSVRLVARDIEHPRLTAALRAHGAKVAILDSATLTSPAEVRDLRRRHPKTSLVLLTDRPSGAEYAQMLAFGASACLGKSTEARDVLNAIHLASRGLQVVPHMEDGRGIAVSRSRSELLTNREAEVLVLLREALSNAQIAVALQVSVETVRTHARNIYRKLGVSSRRELFAPNPVSAPALPDQTVTSALGRSGVADDRYRPRRGVRRPSHG